MGITCTYLTEICNEHNFFLSVQYMDLVSPTDGWPHSAGIGDLGEQ